ncbi:MAG: ribonuclease H-like domain-containing protein [Pseudomonadota bacterium]
MLQHTFCHIPGIGPKKEKELWGRGLRSWKDVEDGLHRRLRLKNRVLIEDRIGESIIQLKTDNPQYFSQYLHGGDSWRIFQEFRSETAYLDIETTGSGNGDEHITTIALYDGNEVRYYVHGLNLQRFAEDIWDYRVVVTYNGKTFDIPFINKQFGIRMDHAHIDLRYVLHSLGYRGGLKGCERQLGLDRDELDGVDGYMAVLLWDDYVHNNNLKALDTLLAYNVLDAANLEALMVMAHNLKIEDTPFADAHRLPVPKAPVNPFMSDIGTIRRLMSRHAKYDMWTHNWVMD